ncbi:hypothetical protein NQ318_003023 [Aromia moschata]|uniref:Mitochondrial pyruvate carrier n=1 Tax=Aromia moschata TaxID=1265417 RepID=A0AAV8YNT9_9CUCU|nr:hypothetical protein NQ318_003023 [Aromia moschata]
MLSRLAAKNGLVNIASRKHLHRFADNFDKYVPEKLLPLWNHPTGPKTIFFWAPLCKWGIVLTGLSDIHRNPENISIPQTMSLTTSGLLSCRYAMVIEPWNPLYFAANFFLFLIQASQLVRVIKHTFRKKED